MTHGMFPGAELAQAWQKGLEIWWQALLGDPRRLQELAARIQAHGTAGATWARDLGRLLQALELLETRVGELEGQVRSLAEGLGGVLALLSGGEAGRPGRRQGGRKGARR